MSDVPRSEKLIEEAKAEPKKVTYGYAPAMYLTIQLYHHRHGVDAGAYPSEEDAKAVGASITSSWREEFEVPEELTDEECYDQWEELTKGSERFELVRVPFNCDESKVEWLPPILFLSTSHMPNESPEFGEAHATEYDFGYYVRVTGGEGLPPVPGWLVNIMVYAKHHGCLLINFDKDGDVVDTLRAWEW